MKGKITLLAAGAAGYVLGARAGRERYEHIKSTAQQLWHSPTVQRTASEARDYAKEKAPEVQHQVAAAASKAAESAREAAEAAKSKVSGDPATSQTPPSQTPPNQTPPSQTPLTTDPLVSDFGSRG